MSKSARRSRAGSNPLRQSRGNFSLFESLAVVGACCLAFCGWTNADSVIDNFNRSNVSPWYFSKGPEFPGATGSLTSGPGYDGTGAQLSYNLSKGGHYVSANYSLPSPLSPAAIA